MKHIEEFLVKDMMFKGQDNSGTALELIETTAQIVNSTFESNRKGSYRKCPTSREDCYAGFVGGAIFATNSTTDISQSKFEDNGANYGGAIFAAQKSIINMNGNVLINNFASRKGVLFVYDSTITINASMFQNNTASRGGVLSYYSSTIVIKASTFQNNTINTLSSYYSTVTINASVFQNNTADEGGVLWSYHSTITIEASEFDSNSASSTGGVLYSQKSIITILCGSNFTENNSSIGAVIYAEAGTKVQYCNYLLIDNNSANDNSVIYLSNSEFTGCDSGNVTISNNLGSLMAFNSNINISGYAIFVNNRPPQTALDNFQEGGAITLFQSKIFFDGNCNLEHNHAENGGAMHSTESKLYVNGNVTIAHNTAAGNGGGVYLSTSELNCQQKSNFVLFNNSAQNKGGGIHAISSSIKATAEVECINKCSFPNNPEYLYIGTRIMFTDNAANWGGGLSLESNAKLYILKYQYIIFYDKDTNTAIFTGNSADYGGAVYVDDDTNSGTCASDPKTECFFQVLALYDYLFSGLHIRIQNIYFSENSADISGSILYGGLLDRCAVSQFAEVYKKYVLVSDIDGGGGIAYFRNVSLATNISMSSRPVRICICTSGIHDCTNHSRISDVKKGEAFNMSLVAVDQVGQPVNATIQTLLNSAESGLAEGQLAKNISTKCTNLTFNVFSPHDSEILALYASDGPCRNAKPSTATVEIHFLPCSCPIGLQIDSRTYQINCTCECHHNISQYMKHCDGHTGSLVKKPQSRVWISYINDTDLTGYLVYPNCPFDYCLSTSPPFYLNQPNGADAQCAFNRSTLLCGSCQPGLSLSLGSSRCLSCHSHWTTPLISITIAAILVGIALVALLLVLNLTVAVGSLNGLIFYANIVYANKSILLPFQESSVVTVFISLLNLELGVDTCYFPGMNTYIKTWLKLAFPAFLFLLMGLIIIFSSYSIRFSKLIGSKDPVATLATLILLSYAKLLEICFESLSVGILKYPDGSSKALWLPDATIQYLQGKHIPLFIVAVVILLIGLIFTALLFSWQWWFYLQRWKIIKVCLREQRLKLFIETYYAPFVPKHRYWTGLLLIARAILYLVAAVNVSNDPQLALSGIVFTMICILFLVAFIDIRMYKKIPLNILDTFFILNVLMFSVFTWYSLSSTKINQKAVAYTSVLSTFTILLLIILYHVYAYTKIFSKAKTNISRKINKFKADSAIRARHHLRQSADGNTHRFKEFILGMIAGPVDTNDFDNEPLNDQQPTVEPTFSIVELPKSQDSEQPEHEEANIYDIIPGPGVTANVVIKTQ